MGIIITVVSFQTYQFYLTLFPSCRREAAKAKSEGEAAAAEEVRLEGSLRELRASVAALRGDVTAAQSQVRYM